MFMALLPLGTSGAVASPAHCLRVSSTMLFWRHH